MYFYKVWVRSKGYRSQEALTYSYDGKLVEGTIVVVPILQKQSVGVVISKSDQPAFQTKAIISTYDTTPLPKQLIDLATWIQQFYASTVGVVTQLILPNLAKLPEIDQDDDRKLVIKELPTLRTEQVNAIEMMKDPNTYLLHGRTGSGKTRVYIEMAKKSMVAGKSVLILCPEIGLTPQLVNNFQEVFGRKVLLLHSRLSNGKRLSTWRTILESKDPLIVIGPRSAIFSPLHDIGLIVLDESHEPAYKQEQAPYYHANRVASKLASLHGSSLIFGSATPSIVDYYLAIQKQKPIIKLEHVPGKMIKEARKFSVIDLKKPQEFSRGSYISDKLIQAIEMALKQKEQVLLYLNRRGTSRLVTCDNCDWQAFCPHCDLPMTYHGDRHQLLCHICGHTEATPTNCPVCSKATISFRIIGTKAVVDEVKRLFPGAKIQRFDTDNKTGERLESQLQNIRDGKVDILIGTQVIAKGLDLPGLTTLGVIAADSSMVLPDFTASERTYQLLNQVLGRIGRNNKASQAIIQTLNPDNQLIAAALNGDWDGFYQSEIEERRKYFFPPFCNILVLTFRRTSQKSAEGAALKFKSHLLDKIPALVIEGPAPSFHEKLDGQYQWQIVIKAKNRSDLLLALKNTPKGNFSYNIDPINLL